MVVNYGALKGTLLTLCKMCTMHHVNLPFEIFNLEQKIIGGERVLTAKIRKKNGCKCCIINVNSVYLF